MPATRRLRGGFTLVEAAVAVALMGSALGAILYVLDSTSRAFQTGSLLARMDAEADLALQRACDALRGADPAWLTPPDPAGSEQQLDFQSTVGLQDDGTPIPGVVQRLAFEYDDLEADDGIDNDGDGLVDEGRLVYVVDVGGANQRRVLARDVAEAPPGEVLGNGLDDDDNDVADDRGFSFVLTDSTLTLRLTLERVDHATNGTLVQTYERTVALRN